jgi:hypothetical protein
VSSGHVAVFGVFSNSGAAESAIGHLKDTGFRSTDVSFLRPLVPDVSANGPSLGHAGWLAGMEDLVVPGAGPCIGAGPIVGALAGMGARGGLGSAADGLIGLGLLNDRAKRYEDRVLRGCILLAAHADAHPSARKAREILERTGAEDIFATANVDEGFNDDDLTRQISHGAAH